MTLQQLAELSVLLEIYMYKLNHTDIDVERASGMLLYDVEQRLLNYDEETH